jgi:16S rRNA (guanine527-N7)-methyltransferase
MEQRDEVIEALGEAQRLGFLGARPIDEVVKHAESFVQALSAVRGSVVDLGAGGGVPGLVIAGRRPDLVLVLVDRRTKRTDFLARVVRRLGWSSRVAVRAMDTEALCRQAPASFDAAVARGFGPPGLTLRTGRDLVHPGGLVVVSEPPTGDRWTPDLLDRLKVRAQSAPAGVACFRRLHDGTDAEHVSDDGGRDGLTR